jgi:hypothetical protein
MESKCAERPRRLVAPRRLLVRAVPLALLVGVGLVSFAGEAKGSSASVASKASPSTLVSHALANAKAGGWVHEVSRAKEKGHTLSAINDIGTTEGRQSIHSDTSRAKVLLVNGVAYVEANAAGVTHYLELPTKHPAKLAGTWFTVPSSDANYAAVTAGTTLTSDFDQLQLAGPYRAGRQTVINHQKVIPIHCLISGTPKGPKASITLYVTATGTTLPIKFVAATQSVTDTTVWSKWGETVHLAAPVNPQPIPNQ